jgi:hypothetical protein
MPVEMEAVYFCAPVSMHRMLQRQGHVWVISQQYLIQKKRIVQLRQSRLEKIFLDETFDSQAEPHLLSDGFIPYL